jgi:hypothetical protein
MTHDPRTPADAIDDAAALALHRAALLDLDEGVPLPLLDEHAVLSLVRAARAAHRLRPSGDDRPPLLPLVAAPVAAPAPAPSAAPPARRAAVAAPPPAPDATFGSDLDVAAMVAVLTQAARDGVPFCEECAKAAAARAAAGEAA